MNDIQIVVTKSALPTTADFRSGLLMLVDKPKDWTSFDVVNKLRYKVRHRHGTKKFKVGHAGTLDPMATGLLLIAIGKYTKLLDQLQGLGKSYSATIMLGGTTPSYDAEEAEDAQYPTAHITRQLVDGCLEDYRGDIMQMPPMYSALKVDGVRLYKKARKGQTVEIKKRPVNVSQLDVTRFDLPLLDVACTVSKGTYIRSLAHDIGQSLQSGGYLTQLRRTRVADYSVEDALSVDQAVEWIENVELSGVSLL